MEAEKAAQEAAIQEELRQARVMRADNSRDQARAAVLMREERGYVSANHVGEVVSTDEDEDD
jgi:hypothetical protein